MAAKARQFSAARKTRDIIIDELWQQALFNSEAYDTFEALVKKFAKKADHTDRNLPNLDDEAVIKTITTLRNRNVISTSQQEKLSKAVVSFFGLSVGSHAALTWVMQARPDVIKIADPDIISLSNLNRLRMPLTTVGKYKVDVVKNEISRMHPFTNVVATKSTRPEVIRLFVTSGQKTDLIVEETDSLEAKLFLRKLAKELKIPLISATDVGDNVFVDVERYDIKPQPEPFLGRFKDISAIDPSSLSVQQKLKLIFAIVGFRYNSQAMLDSLLAIGKDLATWPQLGATATVAGGVITTTLKKILLGEPVASGRYIVSLDDILSGLPTSDEKKHRDNTIRAIKNRFHLNQAYEAREG